MKTHMTMRMFMIGICLGFCSTPCDYWYFSFCESPSMDIKTKVQGQRLPFKRKIELLVSNGIKKGIRKMHVLPAVKPRFRPFFTADLMIDMKKLIDQPFIERLRVDLSKGFQMDKMSQFISYTRGSLLVQLNRFNNLSLAFGPGMESVFVTCSVDDTSLVENVVLSSAQEEPSKEYLNFTFDYDEFRNLYEFSESKIVEDGVIKYRMAVKRSLVLQDSETELLEGDVILSVHGTEFASKEYGVVADLFDKFVQELDTPYVKVFILRRLSTSFLLSRKSQHVPQFTNEESAPSLSPQVLRKRTNTLAVHEISDDILNQDNQELLRSGSSAPSTSVSARRHSLGCAASSLELPQLNSVTHSRSNANIADTNDEEGSDVQELSTSRNLLSEDAEALNASQSDFTFVDFEGSLGSGGQTKQSGSFPASQVIDCLNSSAVSAFSFPIHPNRTEYLNLTVWGVGGGVSLHHFPLAHLSLPIGHILRLCSTSAQSTATHTFQLAESKMPFSAPPNTRSLQLENLTNTQMGRIVSRCFGSAQITFVASDLKADSSDPVASQKRQGFQHANHVNVNPPSMTDMGASETGVKETVQQRRYLSSVLNTTTQSKLANKMKPKLQESKTVANAFKSSLNATLPKFAQSKAAQKPLEVSPLAMTPANEGAAVSGGSISDRFTQMRGNVKKMSTGLLKDAQNQVLIDKAKQSQQKMASKARPFRQFFNRNKSEAGGPNGKSGYISNLRAFEDVDEVMGSLRSYDSNIGQLHHSVFLPEDDLSLKGIADVRVSDRDLAELLATEVGDEVYGQESEEFENFAVEGELEDVDDSHAGGLLLTSEHFEDQSSRFPRRDDIEDAVYLPPDDEEDLLL